MIIQRTIVGKKVVSTIERDYDLKQIDSLLGFADDILDRPAKLSESGDYETMVFHCDTEGEVTDWTELDFARYATKDEALKGHQKMVERWETK